jgi:peptidoglycan/xylan/chitin deacetylase (PgdA/CDA1 family)
MKSGIYIILAAVLAAAALIGLAARIVFFRNTGTYGSPGAGGDPADPAEVFVTGAQPAAAPEPMSVLAQPMDNRSVIDDFSELSGWRGDYSAKIPGCISVSAENGTAEAYRKYEGFLPLGTYLYFKIEVAAPENIRWMTLYLMEDQSGTDYFEYDLVPRLSGSEVTINKREFTAGGGSPEWNNISTVKIAFETNGKRSELLIDEFSTFNAVPCCTVWFDDAWKNTFDTAFPIMRERGIKGTLSVIGSHSGYPAYCNEPELGALYGDGWDLVNHTYSHKNLNELSLSEAEYEISKGFEYLRSLGFTRACNNLVPPYGPYNGGLGETVKKYAVTSRPNWDAFNYLPITDPYNLGYWEVTRDTSPAEVEALLDEAIENDLWIILLFHSVEAPADVSSKYEPDDFLAVMDLLSQKKSKIRIAPLSEVLRRDVMEAVPKPEAKELKPGAVTEDGWRLVWEDEFDSDTPDDSVWNIVERPPSANDELQTYSADCVSQKDGCLAIESRAADGAYFSGCVTTDNKRFIGYGKLEIRARLNSGKGMFPAFWLLPLNGDQLPEIDIMEYLGSEPDTVWHVYHFFDSSGRKDRRFAKVKTCRLDTDFHVYTLEWTEQSLKWSVDGKETFEATDFAPSLKMYLIINAAVGGSWPGSPDEETVFPQSMLIDYVRYYQRQG